LDYSELDIQIENISEVLVSVARDTSIVDAKFQNFPKAIIIKKVDISICMFGIFCRYWFFPLDIPLKNWIISSGSTNRTTSKNWSNCHSYSLSVWIYSLSLSTAFQVIMVTIILHITIVIFKILRRNSKGKRREPAYRRALRRIRGIVRKVR